MKVVLVYLSNYVNRTRSLPSNGLLSLATVLKDSGKYEIQIVNFEDLYGRELLPKSNDFNTEIQTMYTYIMDQQPDVIGFYTMCNVYTYALMLSKEIKKLNPSVQIMFGGPQATLTAKETLENFECIDVIGLGEGEQTILSIVDALTSDKDFSNVQGVAYKEQGEIVIRKAPSLIKNLDELLPIDYGLVDMNDVDSVDIDIGRGCPFSCTFCSSKTFWKRKFRLKSSERIIEEIKQLKSRFKIKEYGITHDLFTANKKRVIEFCDDLIDEQLNIVWGCSSRVDTVDKEMMIKMKESGCKGVFLGIESGSERIQKLVNKNLKLDQIKKVIKDMLEADLEPYLSFIYGFPFEKEEDLRQTVSLIKECKELKIDRVILHSLTYLPETELYKQYETELEYWPEIASNITGYKDYFSNEMVQVIKDNKSIFPQFYQYKTELREKTQNLEQFINFCYAKIFKNFPRSYELLMDYYDNDLLDFFYDFDATNGNYLNKQRAYCYEINYSDVLYEIEECMKRTVCNGRLRDSHNKEALIELIEFEKDIFNFLYIDKEKKEEVIAYRYDVYALKRHSEINDFNQEDMKVKFIRHEDESINVKKISA